MGWAQRSRRRLPAGTRCYLCGKVIEAHERWDRDHVPPKRIFGLGIRRQFNPQLDWLPTHVVCNGSYRKDEEYFVASFAGHVLKPTAAEVLKDLKDAATEGHGVGLIKDVISRFGKVVGPKGELLYTYDRARVERFVWKVVRGLYYLNLGNVLPEQTLGEMHLLNPNKVPEALERIGWFPAVRDTEPMGVYGRVFDYKWIGWKDGDLRGHAFAVLFWDGLLVVMLFHDPACGCAHCAAMETRT